MRRMLLGGAVLAALLVAAPASALAGTIDQQQPDTGGVFTYVNSAQSAAQTFTAGISGGLDRADLALSNTGTPTLDLTVQIRNGSSIGAGTQILASHNLPPSSVTSMTPTFVPVSFNPPASVVAGQKYAIVAYSAAPFPNNYNWHQGVGNSYAGGDPFFVATSPPSGSWTGNGPGDFAFKTYVVPTPPTTPGATLPNPQAVLCAGRHSTQIGSSNADTLVGTPGTDVISGLGGNDHISGMAGKDLVCGGSGKDTLKGGAGNDKLLGQAGKDTLKGGGGQDVCKGGKGNDSGKCEVEKSL